MLRVRPGVLLVRAIFAPTRELITLDFPTLDLPRNAISGAPGAGKWAKSLADGINRARIRIAIVSSVQVAPGKRRSKISSRKRKLAKAQAAASDARPAPLSDVPSARV